MADIFELLKKISSGSDSGTSSTPEFIIAGLGNPEEKYTFTRHNAGFLAMDYISQKCGVQLKLLKYHALCSDTMLGGHRVLLMKPQTYMNKSGEAIAAAASFYKIPAEHCIILVDDICQAPGRMRIRKNGSAGGHNGLKSIIECMASDNFPRIRIGVGEKPNPEYDLADWVVGKIPEEDRKAMYGIIEASYDACIMLLDGKIDEAMGKFNGLKF